MALGETGAIDYRDGRISLLDRALLEKTSREWCQVVKRECDRLRRPAPATDSADESLMRSRTGGLLFLGDWRGLLGPTDTRLCAQRVARGSAKVPLRAVSNRRTPKIRTQ